MPYDLNFSFKSLCQRQSKALEISQKRTPFSLDLDDINDDDVKDILKSLQIGKASGGDCIKPLCQRRSNALEISQKTATVI
jgi:hypothetical protein